MFDLCHIINDYMLRCNRPFLFDECMDCYHARNKLIHNVCGRSQVEKTRPRYIFLCINENVCLYNIVKKFCLQSVIFSIDQLKFVLLKKFHIKYGNDLRFILIWNIYNIRFDNLTNSTSSTTLQVRCMCIQSYGFKISMLLRNPFSHDIFNKISNNEQ